MASKLEVAVSVNTVAIVILAVAVIVALRTHLFNDHADVILP